MCWSCGRTFPPWYQGKYCPDPDCGGRIIEIRDPKFILPTCGLKNSKGSPFNPNERVPRPCCVCGRSFWSTEDEWINGTCPYCGASGPTGGRIIRGDYWRKNNIIII